MSTEETTAVDRCIEDQETEIISCLAPVELIEEIDALSDRSRSEEIRAGLRLQRVMLQESSDHEHDLEREQEESR
jgi:hypothetical protein